MSWDDREDTTIYKVIINAEEIYSIWPVDRENAPGWYDVGKEGTKAECLAYMSEVWTSSLSRSERIMKEQQEAARRAEEESDNT